MGAIKDIVDLTKDLESRAKERRDIDLIHKIQSLALALQAHDAEIVERDIHLMEENSELKRELAESQAEEIRIYGAIEFRRGKRTGNEWVAFCPRCHLPASVERHSRPMCSDPSCSWSGDIECTKIPSIVKQL